MAAIESGVEQGSVEYNGSRVGRPRALDEMKRREICALVSAGASLQSAAEYVGCAYITVYRERRRDEAFRTQLARAKAVRQLAPLQMMRQSAQNNWRAAAWLLERADPEQFGKRRPNAFAAKELRALARDLLDIFDQALDQRHSRAEVTERMQATINYAMRHAWDRRRTGKSLRRAMSLFDAANPSPHMWDDIERSLDQLTQSAGLAPWTDNFERFSQRDLSKSPPMSSRQDPESGENAAISEPMDVSEG